VGEVRGKQSNSKQEMKISLQQLQELAGPDDHNLPKKNDTNGKEVNKKG